MGHRTFVMLSCVVMTFTAQLASALGLGDITLRSSLNQPLTAEIKLLQVGDLSEADILVGLASQEDFERVGVDRPFFLTDLRYDVRLDTPRGDLIVVTSRRAVREPYLNFIVQVRWPSGKLLREYTVLMDLPVFSDQSPGSVAPAQTDFSEPETLTSDDNLGPRSSFDEQETQNDFASESFASEGTYGPVKSNDTLWEIAAGARAGSNISIQQTMIAIQALNPDAFINNNINLLKRGQILRLPDKDQVRDISLRQANAEVELQNREWTSGDGLNSAPQLDARNITVDETFSVNEPEGRVKLSSPEIAFDSNEGRGSGVGDSSTEALENELATTLEQLDKSNKDNTELRSKIESLEEQITTMERMVEVSNEELRALELSIQKTKEENAVLSAANATLKEDGLQVSDQFSDSTSELVDDASEDLVAAELEENLAALADDADSLADADLGEVAIDEDSIADSIASDLVEAEESVAPTNTPAVVVSRPEEEKGLMDYIIYILAGLLAVAVGAYFFIIKRRESGDEELNDDELAELPTFDDEPLLSNTPSNVPLDINNDIAENIAEDILPEELEEAPTEPQTGDVVTEADIYIAYAKYEKATEMLNKGLAEQPDNPDIHLKLLEVYAKLEDVEAFDSQFSQLLALGVEEANDRGRQLRSSFSSGSEFDTGDTDSLEGGYQSDDLHLPEEGDNQTVVKGSSDFDDNLSSDPDAADPFADLRLDTNVSDLDSELDLELGVDSDEADDVEHELDLELGSGSAEDRDLDQALGLGLDLDDADSHDLDEALGFDAAESANKTHTLGDDFTDDLDTDTASLADDLDLELGLDSSEVGGDVPAGNDTAFANGAANNEEASAFDFDSDLTALDADLKSVTETGDDDLDSILGNNSGAVENGEALDVSADDIKESSGDDLDFDISSLDDLDAEMSANSDDIDELLDLSFPEDFENASLAANESADVDDLDLDEDLDLSSLDSELEELTSDLNIGEEDLSSLELSGQADDYDTKSRESNGESVPSLDDFDLGDDLNSLSVARDKVDSSDLEPVANGDDGMFNKALAGVPDANLDFEIPEVDPDSLDDDGELDFLNDSDETATKLDLARAYIDMGDEEGAKDILAEIRAEGSEAQRLEADRLSQRLS